MSVSAEHVPQVLFLCKLAHVGNTQRRTVVAIELAAHLLARTRTSTQMRWHVSSTRRTEATRRRAWRVVWHVRGRNVTLGRHCVFEGALCGEMIALADTTLDLGVLELGLLLRLVALVLIASFPGGDGAEVDVFSDGDGVVLGARGLAFFLAELGPLLALGDARVDGGFDDGLFDAACSFVAAAVFADAVRGYGFAAVLVLGDGLGGKRDLVVIIFFRPVGAAAVC
jgi:hypothetical protein